MTRDDTNSRRQHWPKVKVADTRVSDAINWLMLCDHLGLWTYAIVTRPDPHSDHYLFFIQDADAAFDFKMRWG